MARWEPHCRSLLPLCEPRLKQSTAGKPPARPQPPPTCEHTRLSAQELAAEAAAGCCQLLSRATDSWGMLPALSDAVDSRLAAQGSGEGSAPGCLRRSHPAGMWLLSRCPEERLPCLAETKGWLLLGGDPRWCGGCRSPVRAAGMRWQSGLSCPSASLASGGSPGRRARRWILRPAAPPREGHACGGHSQPQPGPVNSPRATASRSQSHQARESSPMDGENRAALAASLTYAEPRPEPQLSRSLGINHPE